MRRCRIRRALLAFLLALTGGALPALAGQVELVSRVAPGLESDTAAGDSTVAARSLSADGRYLAFASTAPNLVPGQSDQADSSDVFLYDRVAGTTTLVSHRAGAPATAANQPSADPHVSGDGRYVVFTSQATDLVSGQQDSNTAPGGGGGEDVFLFDRLSGASTLVSHVAASPAQAGSGESQAPQISGDGAFVVFTSFAGDLVAGQVDASGTTDIFLFDRGAGTVTLVSHASASPATAANGFSTPRGISGDGRFVAFASDATDLVAGLSDTNSAADVFLFDRLAGTTLPVSRTSASATVAANGASSAAAISADGAWIVFASTATDLVAGVSDTGSTVDLFLYDRAAGTSALVTHASGSASTAAGGSFTFEPRISADGAWIAFLSDSLGLVAGQSDANGYLDAFLYERASGAVTLVSHAAGSPTTAGSSYSSSLELSDDGAYIAFASFAVDLVAGQADAAGSQDVFLFARATGDVSLASHRAGSATATGDQFSGTTTGTALLALSADGAFLAYESRAGDLVAGDRNAGSDAFLYERTTGANTAASRHAPGLASATSLTALSTDPAEPVPSADGRFTVYSSLASELVPGQVDANGQRDVFLYDHATGANLLVSRAAGTTATAGSGFSESADLSADGRFVAFRSGAGDLVPGQAGGGLNVFLFDRLSGTTVLASRAQGTAATAADGPSESPSISADGSRVAFASTATDLTAGPAPCCGFSQVYVYDRTDGTVTLVSRAAGSAAPGNNGSLAPRISADGRWVVFLSAATDLVAGHPPITVESFYLTEIATGATVMVDHDFASPSQPAGEGTTQPVLSADGRFAAFASTADDLVAGQMSSTSTSNVFLFDRATGANRLVSGARGSATVGGSLSSGEPAISADGRFIAFSSFAIDLLQDGYIADPNEKVYLFDQAASTLALVSHANASPVESRGDSGQPSISAGGEAVAFLSTALDMVPGQTFDPTGWVNVYLYDRLSGRVEMASPSLQVPRAAAQGFAEEPRVSADGRYVAFSSSAPDLVDGDFNAGADVFLYARDLPGRSYFTVVPCRWIDTRVGLGAAQLTSGVRTNFSLGGHCGVPVTARAAAVNVTVTQPTGSGYLTFAPGDFLLAPLTSTINFSAGQTRSNAAILALGASVGTLRVDPAVTGGGTVHLIVDVVGYFE